jgi:TPR repeat protein
MSLLTLRVSKRSECKIVFVLLSLDPDVRIETTEIEHELSEDFSVVLASALKDVDESLRVGNKARLEKVGADLARAVLPEGVKQVLAESKAHYLYLDLEDEVVGFPWECVRIKEDFVGRKFKVGRHIRVVDGGKTYVPTSKEKKCTVIANPDGSLKDAALEGDVLKGQLQATGEVDLLKASVTVNEACEVISSKDVFHFAGHSTATGLKFSDRDMTAGDISSLPSVPRMVFLNSCDSGGLKAWPADSQSIVRAFLEAGTRAVVASSSPVASEQAARTAGKFYDRFLKEESLGDSLAVASDGEADELSWARYVLFGHPEFKLIREKAPSKRPRNNWVAVAAAAVLAVIGVFGWRQIAAPKIEFSADERLKEAACLDGDFGSCYLLGEALASRSKSVEAIKYFELACQKKMGRGCVGLARQYFRTGSIDAAKEVINLHCINGAANCDALAHDLHNHGNHDLALKIYEKQCSKGSGLSCVGGAFIKAELGDDVGALELNTKGCVAGHKLACVQYGNSLIKSGQLDAAVKLLRKYCVRGEGDGACVTLGKALTAQRKINLAVPAFKMACNSKSKHAGPECELAAATLELVHADYALEFFNRSCDLGRTTACAKVASLSAGKTQPCGGLDSESCYELGYKLQTAGDLDRADKIYRYLCDKGEIERCNDVAVLKIKRGDTIGAKSMYKDLCSKNVALSCHNFGAVLRREGVLREAVEAFSRACSLKSGQGCSYLAEMLEDDGKTADSEKYFQRACDLDDPTGCNNIGVVKNKRQDKKAAKSDYKKACDLGLSLGCRNLSLLLAELGEDSEALAVLKKSCDKGDVLSCDLMKSEAFAH